VSIEEYNKVKKSNAKLKGKLKEANEKIMGLLEKKLKD
jgi:hypothetical protein